MGNFSYGGTNIKTSAGHSKYKTDLTLTINRPPNVSEDFERDVIALLKMDGFTENSDAWRTGGGGMLREFAKPADKPGIDPIVEADGLIGGLVSKRGGEITEADPAIGEGGAGGNREGQGNRGGGSGGRRGDWSGGHGGGRGGYGGGGGGRH